MKDDNGLEYEVLSFFHVPSNGQAPLPVVMFKEFGKALKYYKEERERIKNCLPENMEGISWFTELSEFDHNYAIVVRVRIIKHEGNM